MKLQLRLQGNIPYNKTTDIKSTFKLTRLLADQKTHTHTHTRMRTHRHAHTQVQYKILSETAVRYETSSLINKEGSVKYMCPSIHSFMKVSLTLLFKLKRVDFVTKIILYYL